MKKTLVLVSLAALCVSCSPPPFDADLLRTAYIAGRMTKEASVRTSLQMDGSTGWEAVFIPIAVQDGVNAGVDCGRGFIRIWTYEGSIIFFTYPGAAGYESFGLNQGFSPPNAEPFRAGTQIIPLKTGDYIGAFVIVPNDIENSAAIFYSADVVNKGFTNAPILFFQTYLSPAPLNVSDTGWILGITVPPSPDPLADTCFILARLSDVAPAAYVEVSAALDKNGLAATPTPYRPIPAGVFPFLDSVSRCQYFHNTASGTSIACIQSGPEWRTYTWSTTFRDLPFISDRIDALLSTGELFSTEDGIARLFSVEGNGQELASFPLGNLEYAGEAFSNGVARMYFTQSFVAGYRLRFYVYSIPTTDLKSLDEP